MAEVHVIGEIIGGSQFHEKTICCRWKLQSGERQGLVYFEASRPTISQTTKEFQFLQLHSFSMIYVELDMNRYYD